MTTTGSTPQVLDTLWPRDSVHLRTQAQQLVLTSYERSSMTLLQYAEAVIKYAESGPEVARRAASRKRVAMLRDAWGPLLKAAFENWTTPAVQMAVMGANRDHMDLSHNPAKNIWGELSVTYKLPPVRTTPEKLEDGVRYVELLNRDSDFNLFCQVVEVLLEACNEVLIWPDVIERADGTKSIKHRYATPDQFSLVVLEEDPTELEAIIIIDEYTTLGGQIKKCYRLWTPAWHAQFERGTDGLERTGFVAPGPDTAPEVDNTADNPYGRFHMQLVRLTDWGDTLLDATTGEDLVDLTIHGGIERALYRYMQKMSGFKTGVAVGQSIDNPPQQLLDPGAIIRIETDGTFQVVDWSVSLKDRLDCMMSDEVAAAASRGINPERYKKTGNYQSGFGARMSERGLAELRAKRSSIFARVEARYKEAACVVWAAHGIEDVPDPAIKLEVKHAPLEYPEAPLDQLQVEEKELSIGLQSQVTLVQRRNPEWTEKQALDFVRKNLEVIAEVNDLKTKRNIPNNPETQGADAEANGMMGPAVRDGQMAPPTADAQPKGPKMGQGEMGNQ